MIYGRRYYPNAKRFLGVCSSNTVESQVAEELHAGIFRHCPLTVYIEHNLVIIAYMYLCYSSWRPHAEFDASVFSPQWELYFGYYLDFLRLKWHFLDLTEMFQDLSLPRWHVLFEIKLKDISLMLLFILNLAIACQSPSFDWTWLSSFLQVLFFKVKILLKIKFSLPCNVSARLHNSDLLLGSEINFKRQEMESGGLFSHGTLHE